LTRDHTGFNSGRHPGLPGGALCHGRSRLRKGSAFRTIPRDTGRPAQHIHVPQAIADAMVRRRAIAAGIDTKIGNYAFRVTGVTA
jgi:hypothetical protein